MGLRKHTGRSVRNLGALALRVVVPYALLAIVWILLSDQAVALVAGDVANATALATLKGMLFIAVTSGALFFLALGYVSELTTANERLEESKREVQDSLGALEHSQEQLQLAMTASHQAMWDYDVTSGEVVTTPDYAHMLGYDPAAFRVDRAAWEASLHPDDRDRATAFLDEAIESGRDDYSQEFRLQKADGGWLWVLSAGSIIERDGRGQPTRMIGTHVDINARKLAEKAHRASEQRFQAVFEASSLGILIFRIGGELLASNPAAESMLGYSGDELRSMRFTDITHPDDIDQSVMARARLFADAGPQTLEKRYVRKDASTMWARASITLLRDADDEPNAIAAIFEDISQPKADREQLVLHKYATDHGVAPILWADSAGTIVYVNESAASIAGVLVSALVGRKVWEFFHALGKEEWTELLGRLGTGTSVELENVEVLRPSGETRTVAAQAALIDQGDVRLVALVGRDVTDVHAASRRKAVRAAVSEALAEADTTEKAWSAVLHALRAGLGFRVGEAWTMEADGMRLAALDAPASEIGALREANAGTVLGPRSQLRGLLNDRAGARLAPLERIAGGHREVGLRDLGVERAAVVPIRHAAELLGAVLLYDDDSSPIPELTLQALDEVASRLSQFTERVRLEDRLRHDALFDDVTGLPNHALFIDRLERALVDQSDEGEPIVVIACQIDQFDKVNDSFGFDHSQQLVHGVARRLVEATCEYDTVARLARDEFALIVESDRAPRFLETLGTVFEAPIEVAGAPVTITLSIGCAYANGDRSAHSLLRDATTAMHHARAEHSGACVFFDDHMHDSAEHELRIEVELRSAAASGQLEVFYQPIMDLPSGSIVAAEALVRWRHPSRGLLLPGSFIGIAEETGLISEIGAHVLRIACNDCASWAAHSDLNVSVNLSANQFMQGDLVETVLEALEGGSLPANRLTLELTETVLMRDVELTALQLARLRRIGVGVSVDDFGTGYSSLGYLKRFAPDAVKIDRTFVSGIPRDRDDAGIVEAVIDMAHGLGLQVVAEGVETPEQASFLTDAGCDFVQGFLFGVPVPAPDFASAIEPVAQ